MFDLHPYTLVVLVLSILIVKQVIAAVGKTAIEDKVWNLYLTYVASKFQGSKAAKLQEKKNEHRNTLKQRNQISAQDEYAKWTKLNRKVDKLETEIKSAAETLQSERATVVKVVGYIITFTTTLPIWFFRFKFRSTVLFYFPNGTFPYIVERLFAFPFITLGGVGLTVWMFSVNKVISNFIFLLTFPLSKVPEKPTEIKETKDEVPKVEEIQDISS